MGAHCSPVSVDDAVMWAHRVTSVSFEVGRALRCWSGVARAIWTRQGGEVTLSSARDAEDCDGVRLSWLRLHADMEHDPQART